MFTSFITLRHHFFINKRIGGVKMTFTEQQKTDLLQKIQTLEEENKKLRDQLSLREDKGPIIGISLIDHSFLYLDDVLPKPR